MNKPDGFVHTKAYAPITHKQKGVIPNLCHHLATKPYGASKGRKATSKSSSGNISHEKSMHS